MIKRISLVLICLFAAFASTARSEPKPNFTGNWKVNVEKSDFGPMPAPTSITMKVDHNDPALSLSTHMSGAQGDQAWDAKYTTDGKESTNEFMGAATKTIASWEEGVLVMNTKADFNGTEINIKAKWSLSADGKVLTNESHIATPQGDVDTKQVFDKQ
jgi:hypothetical protein